MSDTRRFGELRSAEFSSSTTRPALSVCVSLKNRSRVLDQGRELRLFPNCVRSLAKSAERIRHQVPLELVVVDYESDDWPLDAWLADTVRASLPARVISMAGEFSKGEGINIAAAAARGEWLFLCDADMLVVEALLARGIEILKKNEALFPVFRYLDIDGGPQGLELYSFGNAFVSRSMFEKTGGVPEFRSWGGEDDIFHDRVRRQVRVHREYVEGFCHQWHPERCRHEHYVRPPKRDFRNFRRNAANGDEGSLASLFQALVVEPKLPYLTCLCATYLRPRLLANLIHCFTQFDYLQDRCELIVLDDGGQYPDQPAGPNWKVVSQSERFPTLGDKRNALADLAPSHTDAYVVMDDDDVYLPWTLQAHAWALAQSDLSCPDRVFFEDEDGTLVMEPAHGRYHPAWAFSRELFERSGAYPSKNVGEDDALLESMRRCGSQPCSATTHWPPWLIYRWGRTRSYHMSNEKQSYASIAEDAVSTQPVIGLKPETVADWLAVVSAYVEPLPIQHPDEFVTAWRKSRKLFELKMIKDRKRLFSHRQRLCE